MQPLIAKWQQQEQFLTMAISGSVGLVFPMDVAACAGDEAPVHPFGASSVRPISASPKAQRTRAPPKPVRRAEFYAGSILDGSLDAAPAVPARARCSFEPGRSLQPEFAGSVRDEASWGSGT